MARGWTGTVRYSHRNGSAQWKLAIKDEQRKFSLCGHRRPSLPSESPRIRWTRIHGVGEDSAVQGISTVGGPHLAACWGVYNPTGADTVQRVTHANFLSHRNEERRVPTFRAFGTGVDPSRPNREVSDLSHGRVHQQGPWAHWKRLNDVPNGEFRFAHFNSEDGTVIGSGIEGTFLANPFSKRCSAHLKLAIHSSERLPFRGWFARPFSRTTSKMRSK